MKRWLFLLAASACSHVAPSELAAARSAYAVTTTSAVIEPSSLVAARTALDTAERSYKRHGNTDGSRTLAYVAERKAEIAQSAGRIVADGRAIKRTETSIIDPTSDPLRTGHETPVTTTEALVYTAGALGRARQAEETELRNDADIVDGLHRVAHVKEEPGGFAVRVPSAKLFTGSETELAGPSSELDAVAFAIARTAQDHVVRVESRADSVSGCDVCDRVTAQKRAESVSRYLVEHGVAKSKVQAVGLPPEHWDPGAAGLHGRENRVDIRVMPP